MTFFITREMDDLADSVCVHVCECLYVCVPVFVLRVRPLTIS